MIVTDLSNSFNPVPKEKRIVNKKLLKDKKGKCEICGKVGQTEKHHKKTHHYSKNQTFSLILRHIFLLFRQ